MRQNKESGFTLIEVLIAMALLAVGLLALGMMQAHFAEGNAQSRQMIHATDIVTNKIEELSSISDSTHPDLQESGNPHTENITSYPLDYTLEWNVDDNTDQTLTIDLTVRWSTGGQGHNVRVSWLKAL